jgi:lipid-binding SYLF domain-containing protein
MHNRLNLLTISSLLVLLGAAAAHAQGREEARLLIATQVLTESRGSPDQFVPDRLLERAYGIAVIPDVTKVAVFAGGRRGNGVLVVRDKDGRFTNPIFVNLTGGSIGWQFGVQSTDVVLVFTTKRSIDSLTSGKLTLGADASVAAGPVGRQASAATDPTFSSEVYSYSRNRGLFIGVALDGSALTIDDGADARFYDRGVVTTAQIVNRTVTTNSDVAHRFLAAIASSTGSSLPPSASAAPIGTPPVPTNTAAVTPPPGTSTEGAKAFPMADPKPGQEPPSH